MNQSISRRPAHRSLLCAIVVSPIVTLLITAGCSQRGSLSTRTPTSGPSIASVATTQPVYDVPPADPAVAEDAKKTLTYLASDELEGRGVGTHGIDLAADYIEGRYKTLGLKPVDGASGYFFPFEYPLPPAVGEATRLTINDRPLEVNKSFIPLSVSKLGEFAGDLAFVGYGISDSKLDYDDYNGIDVTGKIVVAIRYEPTLSNGDSAFTSGDFSPNASFSAKARAAKEHGAIGLLIVNPPALTGTTAPTTAPATAPTATTNPASTQPRPRRRGVRILPANGTDPLVEFNAIGPAGNVSIPVIQITQKAADDILAQAAAPTLAVLHKLLSDKSQHASQMLNGIKVAGNVAVDKKNAQLKNVMAVLPGKGAYADEFVVVGAHYDHVGRGLLPGSLVPGNHDIHHGADDNGSGTTAVIELATKLTKAGPLDRSVLFITFSAEEEGLIGSAKYVQTPTIPLNKVVAMLNLDMVGRLRDEALYVGGSGTAASFEAMLKRGDEQSPLKLLYNGPMIDRGGMGPSDHESFARKKVPVVFFFTGLHRDYHTPTDTVEKINFDGIAQIVSLGEYVVRNMSTMPRETYIAKYDGPSVTGNGREGGATLGVMPDYAAGSSIKGVPLSGVREGTPAEAAGLKEGDVIVQLNSTKIETIYDLTDFLGDAKPGQAVTIRIERDKKPLELHATLGGGPGRASNAATRAATRASTNPTHASTTMPALQPGNRAPNP